MTRRYLKDRSRLGTGLAVNGVALRTHGRCTCKAPLYTQQEVAAGACVDCQIKARREIPTVDTVNRTE